MGIVKYKSGKIIIMGNITQKALTELLQYIQSIRVDSNGQASNTKG
jgi:hypothetical protein